MQYYPHIDTCFKRSQEKGPNHNKIIYGDWTRPEFEALKDLKWEATEKIDGTNMSYQIICTGGKMDISIAGKTPAANIPGHLLKVMHEKLTPESITKVFGKQVPVEGTDMFRKSEGPCRLHSFRCQDHSSRERKAYLADPRILREHC